jgi:hypothetical protein
MEGFLFADAADRRAHAVVALLSVVAMGFIGPWWGVVFVAVVTFASIILRPSVRTLELVRGEEHERHGGGQPNGLADRHEYRLDDAGEAADRAREVGVAD